MAREDSFDIFGADPFGRDIIYGLSSGRDRLGLAPARYLEQGQDISQGTVKRKGYFGEIPTNDDSMMTEFSSAFEVGGKTVQYPLIVPTLTVDELRSVRDQNITPEINQKAQQFALDRLSRGLDPFATTQELRYPQPQGLNPAPSTDRMQATPRGFISGLFSDVLGGTFNMPQMPRTGIPAVDVFSPNINLFNKLALGDVQKTAERISYGQPLTTGSGMTLKPREETVFAGMAVAPLVGEAASLGARGVRAGARMVGQGIAENVAMGRSNLPSLLAEPKPSLFAVEPNAMMLKPQAPVSELGFYSAAEQAAMNLQRNKGTGQAFLNDLMKAPDVKKDELAWTGLDDFLKDKPNVTKQEVQDFIANNKVDLQEVQLSGDPNKTRPFVEWSPSDKTYLVYGDDEVPIATFNTAIDAQKFVDQNYGKPTQYSNYQLAGGENYREILLKMPNQWDKPRAAQIANEERIKALRQEMYGTSGTNEIRSEISRLQNENTALQKQISEAPIYKSSHFDQPNILAHIRVNDRVDADGKKMLLVEEIQSDWHQAGREKGYETPELKNALKEYESLVIKNANGQKLTPNEMARVQELRPMVSGKSGGVPDAPFKDTWYQLSLKRILKYAADNGYERVGLTTGKQQADRYQLSNEVDEINVIGRTDRLTGEKSRSVALDLKSGTQYRLGVDNNGVIDNVNMLEINNLQGKKLSEVVGKDIAKKIMEGNSQTIKGEGLNIGGEGMKKYYDEIYPKFLEKYGKKWDASVGETKVNTVKERAENSMIPIMGQEPVRYIDITPKMKESVGKGQPLFTAIPAGTLGLGGLEYADPFANPLAEDTTR